MCANEFFKRGVAAKKAQPLCRRILKPINLRTKRDCKPNIDCKQSRGALTHDTEKLDKLKDR
jgi:hypothetical protein